MTTLHLEIEGYTLAVVDGWRVFRPLAARLALVEESEQPEQPEPRQPLEAGVAYRLNDEGRFVRAEPAVRDWRRP